MQCNSPAEKGHSLWWSVDSVRKQFEVHVDNTVSTVVHVDNTVWTVVHVGAKFPIMSAAALRLLACHATCRAGERNGSMWGSRAPLSPAMTEMLFCSQELGIARSLGFESLGFGVVEEGWGAWGLVLKNVLFAQSIFESKS